MIGERAWVVIVLLVCLLLLLEGVGWSFVWAYDHRERRRSIAAAVMVAGLLVASFGLVAYRLLAS